MRLLRKLLRKKPKKVVRKKAKKTKKTAKKTKKTPRVVRKVKKKVKKAKKVVKKAKKAHRVVRKVKKKIKKTAKKTKKSPRVVKRKTKKPAKKRASTKPARKRLRQELIKKVVLGTEAPSKKKSVKYPVLPMGDSERVKMLVPLLKDLVRKKVLSDWRINMVHIKSSNIYVGNDFVIDNLLSAVREDVIVTIYKRFPDGTLGEAQLPIIATTESKAMELIVEASKTCEYARKKEYNLPEPEEDIVARKGHDARMLTEFLEGNGENIPLRLYEKITETMSEVQDVKTNCFEIMSGASTTRILNSNGIDISFHKTTVYVEFTLSCKKDDDEQEFQWRKTVVSPDQIDIIQVLEEQTQTARDAVIAVPSPGFKGDVLLSGNSLTDFFTPADSHNPIILHSFAKLTMMGVSQLTKGKPLGEFLGEPFTIRSNPKLPLGLITIPVDEEGTPLHPVNLIRTGVFANHIANARYSQHMNLRLTGGMSNLQIGAGATREEHLRGNKYVEIISFSWFNPDPFSGEFSSEIRLGYLWKDGKKTPFKGGFFTGNVFDILLKARLSREVIQSGRYYGPRAILFKDAKITKQE